jgi:hypothetical protein
MTRNVSARIAGATYLLYIGVAFPSMVLFGKATAGDAVSAQLANIAQHGGEMRATLLLGLCSIFCALILAVTLNNITRDEDQEVAMFGLVCRAGEGILGGIVFDVAGLLWLATGTGPGVPTGEAANTIAAFLLKVGSWQVDAGATLFAAGSTAFCYLLLRGRMIPVWLAWLGVAGSALVWIGAPLDLTHIIGSRVNQLMYLPIAVFEITVAIWFLIKGVAPLRQRKA